MAEISSSRVRDILSKTVGPAPWGWATFPAIYSPNSQRFVWTHHGEQGPLAYLVTLNAEGEPDNPRLALNTYCRPFAMPPSYFGVWCPDGRSIRLAAFDPDHMKPFEMAEIAGCFKQSGDRIYAATAPVGEFEVPFSLTAGLHKVEVPSELRTLDELIVPTNFPARNDDDPAFALYVFYLQAGLLEVLPQKWFTRSQYEIGKEWITKAVRDPGSHRICGECFGAGSFVFKRMHAGLTTGYTRLPDSARQRWLIARLCSTDIP